MTPRPAVHAESGHRLGASHPRQEGPADLRLIPPALATWGASALAVGRPMDAIWPAAVVALVAGLALLGWELRRRRQVARAKEGPRTQAELRRPRTREPETRTHLRTPTLLATAAALLCAAGGALSAGLHSAGLYQGPIPELAGSYTTVTVELTVTSDPRVARPRVNGDRQAPPSIVFDADVRRVTFAESGTVTTRTPVLVIARHDPAAAGGGRTTSAQPPITSPWLSLLPSTRVHLRAPLSPPLPGGADRIAAVLRVPGAQPPRVIEPPSALQRTAGELRAGLREATDPLSADARALLPGLVVGDTTRVPPDLEDAFRATDLTHLLAVSGSNLTIVLVLLIGPPALAMRAERRGLAPRLGLSLRTTAVCGGVLTLAFVVVCRPDPSVLRAAACGAIALLAIATGRRRSLLPALAAAALLLLLYDPWLSHSYGFLLSVLATGALLVIAPGWSAALQRRGVPPRLAEALAAAGSAQAVCAPVVVVISSRVSLVAIPCNLLAELAVAPATVLGFATLALAPFAMPAAKALAWCAGWPTEWVASVARTGAEQPGAQADWPDGWTGGLLLAALVLALLPLARRVLRHPAALIVCASLLVLAVLRPAPLTRVLTGWPPPDWRFVMCDVGQGDASVLATGPGTAVVVDAGPDPRLVDRCLHALGVTRIPLVLLTHFHADHVAGLPGVLKGRSVGAIQTTGLQDPPGQAAFVRAEAEKQGVPVVAARAGERRRAGPVRWQVLWPPADRPGAVHPPGVVPPQEANDASVTLLVRTAGLTLLLPGDLEPPSQQALLKAYPGLPPVDVLKVPHHGSPHQDPRFLQRTRPRLAVIGVGQDNGYGHPSPAVLTALRSFGTTVARTDMDGAVAVTGNGRTLHVHTTNGTPTTPAASTPQSSTSAATTPPPPPTSRSPQPAARHTGRMTLDHRSIEDSNGEDHRSRGRGGEDRHGESRLGDDRVEAYLRRIGADRPRRPDAEALRLLQERHLRSVPFENLSIHLGEEIRLESEALVAKIVDARRGGFCYELNGAFAALLTALGFDVTLLQARVYDGQGRPGIPYDHLALRVCDVDGGVWLADVGFGAHSLHPLVYGERGEQRDPDGVFRIAEAAGGDLDLFQDGKAQFVLDPRPRALRDFTAGAWYHRTSPDSHFTRSLVCSLRTDRGRTTLSGRKLTVTEDGRRRTAELATDAEVLAAYRDHFGMPLDHLPKDPTTT